MKKIKALSLLIIIFAALNCWAGAKVDVKDVSVAYKTTGSIDARILSQILSDDSTGEVVYVTQTGTKYHKSTCKFLKDSKVETTKTEAISKGYEACKVCKP